MALRKAYESLAALGAALQRSRVEPKGVRLPVRQIVTLLDHGERFMAHLSLVRHSLARLADAEELPRIEARWPKRCARSTPVSICNRVSRPHRPSPATRTSMSSSCCRPSRRRTTPLPCSRAG